MENRYQSILENPEKIAAIRLLNKEIVNLTESGVTSYEILPIRRRRKR